MNDIVPAIIPKSFEDLQEKLSLVAGYTDFVQIDVLDGKLTSQKSWPYIAGQGDDFACIIREEEGMPYWEDTQFEIDLMVADPEPELAKWVAAGAQRLVVHFESFKSKDEVVRVIREFKEKYSLPGSILSVQIGLAANLDTEYGNYKEVLSFCDFFQCMGIAEIGVQGNPFDERSLDRIKEVKADFPSLLVSVDGGVTLDSAPKLLAAGAQRLVVGSAIFRSDDIPATIEELKSLE